MHEIISLIVLIVCIWFFIWLIATINSIRSHLERIRVHLQVARHIADDTCEETCRLNESVVKIGKLVYDAVSKKT